ncbi:hypothetical protein SAMN04488005_1068 [Yoonia tamlensis]|uniref:Lipoprotein n=1 Tax=Yoonia tamlensis TaxID=390270 RepID=A0A1I6G4K8_9RHOB|nr:hypothetical protein [Yoonia tamlensis]SFR37102.1 hypothetical protein SAMN04488005_1068 [Yoonia tamlensis]
MYKYSKPAIVLTASTIALAGCTIDRPDRSDLEGPGIDFAFSGGAEFTLSEDSPRRTPADSCAIVRDVNGGTVNNRSVDVSASAFDQSGMNRFRITVEGEGVRRGAITVTPSPNPRLNFNDTRDVDVIELVFFPEADGVLNGGIVQFSIDSPFTPGVTISAFASDSFGNETSFAPFELISALGAGICNY